MEMAGLPWCLVPVPWAILRRLYAPEGAPCLIWPHCAGMYWSHGSDLIGDFAEGTREGVATGVSADGRVVEGSRKLPRQLHRLKPGSLAVLGLARAGLAAHRQGCDGARYCKCAKG